MPERSFVPGEESLRNYSNTQGCPPRRPRNLPRPWSQRVKVPWCSRAQNRAWNRLSWLRASCWNRSTRCQSDKRCAHSHSASVRSLGYAVLPSLPSRIHIGWSTEAHSFTPSGGRMLLNLTPDELLSTTRSVRKRLDFTRPVESEVVRACLALALQAPNFGNGQRWRWLVVTDPTKRQALAEGYRRGGGDHPPAAPPPPPAPEHAPGREPPRRAPRRSPAVPPWQL